MHSQIQIVCCTLLLCVATTALISYICNEKFECIHSKYNCSNDIECNVTCNGTHTCWGVQFICPSNANCNINCYGGSSCRGTSVNASETNTSNVIVNGDGNHCL